MDWTGHADLVEGPDGKYYAVFLGIRPNEKDRVNAGRETFMLPVDWSGDFPVFENGLVPLKPKIKMPAGVKNLTGQNGFLPNGNFTFSDDFKSKTLDYRWIGMRGPREAFISQTKTGLVINPSSNNIKALAPVSSLFHRQQHNSFDATVTIKYAPKSEKDLAGLVHYQSERFNYAFGVTKNGNDNYLVLARTERGNTSIVASEKVDVRKPIQLQIEAKGDDYRFNYSTDSKNFKNLGGTVSGDILSTNVAGGFTGSLIGLYATSGNDILPQDKQISSSGSVVDGNDTVK